MAWLLPPERDIGVLRAPVRSTLILLGLFLLGFLAFGLLERLGIEVWLAPIGVIAGAVAVFIVAALLSHSRRAVDFYVADRRTPASFGGLAVAAGFAGLLTIGLAGGAFGTYDEFLVMAAGFAAGLVFVAFTIAPRLRHVGGYSAGDYLALRFGGTWVRLIFAVIAFTVSFLLLVAQLKITAPIFATVIGLTPRHALYAAAGVTVLAVLPGGMRSLTWTQAIQYFIVLVACLVPAGSLIMRGTAGDMAAANEFASLLGSAIPNAEASGGDTGTALPFLLAAFGMAALPHLTARALTAGSERAAATSMIWAVLYAVILVLVGLFLAILFEEIGDWSAAGGLLQIAALFASLPAVLAGLVLAGALAAPFCHRHGVAFRRRHRHQPRHLGRDRRQARHGRPAHHHRAAVPDRGRRLSRRAWRRSSTSSRRRCCAGRWRWPPPAGWRRSSSGLPGGGRSISAPIAGMVAGFGFTGLAFVLQQSGLFGGAAGGGIAAMGAPTAGIAGLGIAVAVTVGVSVVMPAPEADGEQAAQGGDQHAGRSIADPRAPGLIMLDRSAGLPARQRPLS